MASPDRSNSEPTHGAARCAELPSFPVRARLSWIAVLIAARGVLLVSLADVFYYGEELAKGASAKALLDRLPTDTWRLAYHAYEGGGFVTSVLDALAFAVLGPSLLAQKLVALAFAAAILWVGVGFVSRWFGSRAAHAFAALYVFAPATVQKLSLLNLGIHFQALLFSVSILHGAASFSELERPSGARAFMFGLAVGFGFYFSYQCAIAILVAALWIFLVRRELILTRAGALAIVGALVGLAPLAWMFAHAGARVFDVHGESWVDEGAKTGRFQLLAECAASLFRGRTSIEMLTMCALPFAALLALLWVVRELCRRASGAAFTEQDALATSDGWLGDADARVGVAGAALLISARRLRGRSSAVRIAVLVFAFLAVFAAAYVASGFAVGEIYHYFRLNRLVPAWFALVLLAVAGLGAKRGAFVRKVALAAIAVAVLDGASDLVRTARAGVGFRPIAHLEVLAQTKGYDYRDYLGKLATHLDLLRPDARRVMLGFREAHPELLVPIVAETLDVDPSARLDELAVEERACDPQHAELFLEGWGLLLRRREGGTLVSRLRALASKPPDWRQPLAEAIGRAGSGLAASPERLRAELAEVGGAELPEEFAAAFLRGFGWRLYESRASVHAPTHWFDPAPPAMWLDRERAREFIEAAPRSSAASILEGYDRALRAYRLN